MNKKWMILFAIVMLALMPLTAQDSTGSAMWRNGNGNNGNGNGTGNGPINIYDGTPFSFSGIVVSYGNSGNALVVATDAGELTVIGLGPRRYWKKLGIAKPVEGDSVSGNGYTVDYNGNVLNVLTDITVNGVTVQLRDEEGRPAWKRIGNRGNWGGNGPGNGNYEAILNGTPFSYTGEVIDDIAGPHGFRGSGLVIATSDGNVEVGGLGPNWYWDRLEISKPVVGDTVTADGYKVDINGTVVNILISIILGDGTTVQLRDPETGAPLWHGGRKN
jgi:hypothetical protein